MRKYLCMVVKSTNKKEHDIPTIKLSLSQIYKLFYLSYFDRWNK